MAEMTMIEAIRSTLGDALERDERVIVLGQDVGVNGGVFRATEGLQERFGEERVVDMPLAEAVIVGSAVGPGLQRDDPDPRAAVPGLRQPGLPPDRGPGRALRFRSQGSYPMPMVIRAPFGGNVRTPELHSDAHEAKYANAPGLKVVMPATARDAKGMLAEAIRDPDPGALLRAAARLPADQGRGARGGLHRPAGQGAHRARGRRPRDRRLQRRGRHRRARRRARRRGGLLGRRARPAQPRAARRRRAARGGRRLRARGRPARGLADRAASAPSSWRRSRRRRSGRCRRRSAASPPPTRRTRRARSRSSTCPRSIACSTRSARRMEA